MQTKNVGTHPGASKISNHHQNHWIHHSVSNGNQRKSPRADFHNYSGGNYFITICTLNKQHYFGDIINGEMIHSEIGKIAFDKLATLSNHYTYVDVPLFVVMPNQIHTIICINEPTDAPGCVTTTRTALSVVIGAYKQSVTMYARRNDINFSWQAQYHDHIIRGVNDGNRIAKYIENNIACWCSDCFQPNNVEVCPATQKTDYTLPPNSQSCPHRL